MSHLVLLWQGMSTFIAGFLVGISLVCVGAWLFVVWLTIGETRLRIGSWWAGLGSASGTYEAICPIILQELPKSPHPSTSALQEESCNWLNSLVNYFLFPSTPMNGLQRRIRTSLLDRFLGVRRETGGFINCLTVEEVRGSRRSPTITKITLLQGAREGEGEEEELHLALDVSFKGDASILTSGILGLGLGKVLASLRICPSSGRLLLKFTRLPSPRVSLMLSDLPNFTLTIDRGESSLGRVANLASLILSSLLRTHAIFPHFQSFLLKPEAETFGTSLMAPLWRSSRRFLRVQVQSVVLNEEMAAANHGAAVTIEVTIGGTSKCKSGFLLIDQHNPVIEAPQLVLQHALSHPNSSERDSISVTVIRKGGPSSGNGRFVPQRKTILFTATLPLDCIPSDVPHTMGIFPEAGRAAGCRVNLELLSCTEAMSMSRDPTHEWPLTHGLRIRPGEEIKYLNGLDWSNFKRAWRRFRKKGDVSDQEKSCTYDSNSMNTLQQQLEELIQSLSETSKSLSGTEQVALKSSLSSLSSELSTLVPPTPGAERLEEISQEIKSLQRSYSHLHGESCSLDALHCEAVQVLDPPLNPIDDSFELLCRTEEIINLKYVYGHVRYHLYSAPDSFSVKLESDSASSDLPEMIKTPAVLVDGTERIACSLLIYSQQGILCVLAGGKNVLLMRSIDCIDSLLLAEPLSSTLELLTVTVKCVDPHKSCTLMLSLASMMALVTYFNGLSPSSEWSIDPRNHATYLSSLITLKDNYVLSGLVYAGSQESDRGSLLIPIIGIAKSQLELILGRTSSTALTPRLVNPQSTKGTQDMFSGEILGAFGAHLRLEYVSCVAKGFLKRSLPLPGQLFLTSLGILFASKISEKRILLPKNAIQSCELHAKWHTKLLSVAILGDESRVVEFMQITDAFISALQDWCLLNKVPLPREAAK